VFRYEVRRWRDGVIADADEAVASPQPLSQDPLLARRLLDLVGSLPSPVWGRDELRTGEMWNSNSVIAWLLARSGLPMSTIKPPGGGRAPGWQAGLVTAHRQQRSDVGGANNQKSHDIGRGPRWPVPSPAGVSRSKATAMTRYRRDIEAARRRLAAREHDSIQTADGSVQYAEHGQGPPVLFSHPLVGGFDPDLGAVAGAGGPCRPPAWRPSRAAGHDAVPGGPTARLCGLLPLVRPPGSGAAPGRPAGRSQGAI
jgi:hypothetical protein